MGAIVKKSKMCPDLDHQKVRSKVKTPHQFQSFGKAPTFKNQQNPTYSHHTPLNSLNIRDLAFY